MKKSAFTLIELLVVIAIISILASLAIPAYTKVMERARSTQDLSNMRQIGLGIAGYTNDNSDTYFPSGAAWTTLLNTLGSGTQYIPVWKVFQSPFDQRTSTENGATAPASPISYDINTNLMGQTISNVASPSNCIVMSVAPNTKTTTLSFQLNPTTAVGSLTKTSVPLGEYSGGVYVNVLYADSHVAMLKTTLFQSGTTVTPAIPTSGTNTVSNITWNK